MMMLETFCGGLFGFWWLVLSSLLLLSNNNDVVDGYKHSYYTKNDDRTLIGPLGYPFGFLSTGHYKLTVFDFDLSIGVHDDDDDTEFIHGGGGGGYHHGRATKTKNSNNKDDKEVDDIDDVVRGVGFLLKRFDDEAEFNHYMSWLEANKTRCAFQPFLNPSSPQQQQNFNYGGGGDDYFYNYDYNYDYNYYYYYEEEDDVLNQDDDEYRYENDGYGEILDDPSKEGIFLSMKSKSRWKPTIPIVSYDFEKGQEGLYFLIYQICLKPAALKKRGDIHLHTTFELDFHSSNLDVFGNESYLPAGEMILPHMFFYFSVLYMICVFLWISNIRMIKNGGYGHWADPSKSKSSSSSSSSSKNNRNRRRLGLDKPIVYPIHYLMAMLLVLKFAAIFFESIRYHYLRVSGQTQFWSAVYYIFAFMKGTILFTVILLIGSGWSFVKPFLSDREKKMVFGIIILQTVNNLAIVILTQRAEGEKSYDHWTAILHMVDILCCCAVLIPIVWQVNALEKNIEQSNGDHDDSDATTTTTDDDDDDKIQEVELDDNNNNESSSKTQKNGRLAAKLKLFRSFYLLVVCYIYVTRIVVYLFATMLDYRHEWVRYFVVEAVTLAFYCTVGMQFRPMSENPYLTVSNKDEEESDDNDDQNGDTELVSLTAQSNGIF